MDVAEAEALPRDLVFVDLETTGGNAAFDRITEVGIVRVAEGELVEEWSSLVNPQRPIPSYIAAFTGITDQMVATAPTFGAIAATVMEKLRGESAPLFVAHNARFDYSFLRAEFRRLDTDFNARVLCTVKLSRRLFPQHHRHNLDALMERHHLVCGARHRALGDARVLKDLWFTLRRELPQDVLAVALSRVLGANKLPDYLPAGLADELPEGPGVYRFFDEQNSLLFIGKSHSLRVRILEHFAGEPSALKDRKLAKQVRRIDWLETAGELGAQLKEAQWVKSQRPPHNARLKRSADAFTMRVADAPAEGMPCVELVALGELAAKDLAACHGVFQTHKDARKALIDIARAQRLCLKVLGVEESQGSCLGLQLGLCKGACVGKEPLSVHELRLRIALSALKLKRWPFPGRIALREGRSELHVLDHWTYLGTARSDEELADLAAVDPPLGFDVDVYRILGRYLDKHPAVEWHELRDGCAVTLPHE